MIRHRTPAEKRADAAAEAAIARAWAHTQPPTPHDKDTRLGELHPYVTPARARQIRLHIEETTC
ncbi:hypothetical protein [Actinoplanes sp. CA-252034]|uniref:hypothetical protein n=1 Tax=Actinoplanes sp. CA-252034 TaxID=3239906 RepID=UPI003D9823B6